MRQGNRCPLCDSGQIRLYKTKKLWACYACKKKFSTPKQDIILTPKGSPKRKPLVLEIMTRKELAEKIGRASTLKKRAFLSFLYVTATRINEVIKIIKANDVELKQFNKQDFLVINQVPTLKRKLKVKRNIPIPILREEYFVNFIVEYVDTLQGDDVLFDFSPEYAWKIVNQCTGMFPHYLRHLRLTNLVTDYGLTTSELRQFTGWTNDSPASVYVHLGWQDIAKKMSS